MCGRVFTPRFEESEMSAHCISLEAHDAVAVLRIDRPPANAISLEMGREMEAAFATDAVAQARALVITGTGHFFSGGLDLKQIPNYSQAEQRELLGVLNRLLGKLYAHPAPVVAAINGHAVAGGFILALAADYRVGPTGAAQFGLTEARVGIPFPAVPMIILHAELAPQDVRYGALYARSFGSGEAQRRGALDELRPPEAVLTRGLEVARDLAGMPADCYRRVKHQLRRAAIEEIDAVLATGADPMFDGWLADGTREAAAAMLEGAAQQRERSSEP
jgi:enoyl-CoA hydratase/carnithine racemase